MRTLVSLFLALAGLLLADGAAASAGRTFVSAQHGVDSNSALNCAATSPCRTFATALTVTAPGGEVIAMDSGGYGPFVIAQSVSIIAPDGVYAGIAVPTGTGIAINAAGISVRIHGLTLNGTGGSYGIFAQYLASLTVENTTFSNFGGNASTAVFGIVGLAVQGAQTLSVIDSTFRDCYIGIGIESVASATVSGSRFLGTTTGPLAAGAVPRTAAFGVYVITNDGVTSPAVAIVDCVVNDGVTVGVNVGDQSNVGPQPIAVAVDRSVIAGGDAAVEIYNATAAAYGMHVSLSNSTFTQLRLGGVGLIGPLTTAVLYNDKITDSGAAFEISSIQPGGVVQTFGDNTFSDNTVTSAGGSLTPIALH